MSELIKSFDMYNDFERSSYFTICFDTLSSAIAFQSSVKETKENMEKALEILNLATWEVEVVFKNWTTEDSRNADFSKDFPYQYLFKSTSHKLIVWVSLEDNDLYVQFLYDVSDTVLEEELIDANHRLRTSFGVDRQPTFKVLSKDSNGGSFHTKKVRTAPFDLDINKMYNDDFQEVHQVITESFDREKAGLILLHGTPGTGKTSYIRNLISENKEMSFIFIQNEFVNELLHPNFISFLLKHRNAVLIIEDAEKVLTTREHVNESSVVSTVLQLTDGLLSDHLNIKIICTFNTSIEKIDKALLRKGRMIAYYEFNPLSKEKASELMSEIGYETVDKDMTLADIYNYKDKNFEQKPKKKAIGFGS